MTDESISAVRDEFNELLTKARNEGKLSMEDRARFRELYELLVGVED